MKKVNFITTLSPQKQHEIRYWFWVTLVLALFIFIINAYFIIPQVCLFWSLKKEMIVLHEKTKLYTDVVKNKDTLKSEYDNLRIRENKIDMYTNRSKNPYRYIAVIMQACNEQTKLESLRCNKKECEITILCPNQEHATLFIKHLTSSDVFSRVKMTSLQQEGQSKMLRCVIKGMIIKS
jgi:Tfp pilus assembly protein PilN